MSEGIEHNNIDRKSSRHKCVLSMFRLEIRKRPVNQRDECHSGRAFCHGWDPECLCFQLELMGG